MKHTVAFLLILSLFQVVLAQSPDRWHGLVIDESNPEQTREKLGQPKSDKPDDHWHLFKYQWFAKDVGKKLRTLTYNNVEGFKTVRLKFDSNSKLVSIHLEPKAMAANVFTASYPDVEFRDNGEVRTLADFNRPRDSRPRPEPSYWGATFELIAVTEKAILIGAGYGGSSGRITIIEFTSRTLENRASELLK